VKGSWLMGNSTAVSADPPLRAPDSRRFDRARRGGRRLVVHLVNGVSTIVADDPVSRWVRKRILLLAGASIGPGSSLHGGTWVTEPSKLRIGQRCFVNRRCYLDLEARIELGDDVMIGHGTTIVTSVHAPGPSTRRAGVVTHGRPVFIGRGAWLGANVTVLPGVHVGPGAVVAAGSLVRTDVPADHLVAGVPARVIRPLDGPQSAAPWPDPAGATAATPPIDLTATHHTEVPHRG
jgi:maltose O-acetyltransferase